MNDKSITGTGPAVAAEPTDRPGRGLGQLPLSAKDVVRAAAVFRGDRPTTDAERSALRSTSGRRSIRAASTAWTVSGMTISSMPSTARQRSPSRRKFASQERSESGAAAITGWPSSRTTGASPGSTGLYPEGIDSVSAVRWAAPSAVRSNRNVE